MRPNFYYSFRIYLVFLLLIPFSSCSNIKNFLNTAKPDPTTNIVLRFSYEDVWKEALKVATKTFPLYITDMNKGIIETEKILEFSLESQYRQYVQMSVKIKRVADNFTAISCQITVKRFSPIFYDWYSVPAEKREAEYLEAIKAALGKK